VELINGEFDNSSNQDRARIRESSEVELSQFNQYRLYLLAKVIQCQVLEDRTWLRGFRFRFAVLLLLRRGNRPQGFGIAQAPLWVRRIQ
jgi:hypothetical protein